MKQTIKLSEKEKLVLKVLVENYYNHTFLPFAPIVERTGLDRRQVRLACRSLKRKGLAQFSNALFDFDGNFKGSGYAATPIAVVMSQME